MVNKRYLGKQLDAKLLPKDENGNNCCRFCGKSVLPPRRTMCSAECAHEIAIRNNGRYLREQVFKRDNGICAICMTDTKKIANELTEKEIELIELLKKKPFTKKKEILSIIWKYSSDADTHTVETHIYRLRKKIKEIFNDELFIKSEKKGYTI